MSLTPELQILLDVISKKGNILDVAERLHTSIAEVSIIVDKLSEKVPKFKEFVEKNRWPRSVNSGHIYLGEEDSKIKLVGNNRKTGKCKLNRGDYVIVNAETTQVAKGISHKFCEIWSTKLVEEKLYQIVGMPKMPNGEYETEWNDETKQYEIKKDKLSDLWYPVDMSYDDVKSEILEICRKSWITYRGTLNIKVTSEIRKEYKKDEWMSVVRANSLRHVNTK